jgi:hypothetical protein
MLFRALATLRTDIALFEDVDQLRWKGAYQDFHCNRGAARFSEETPRGIKLSAPGVWRIKGEYASLMEMRICRVSFTTTPGIRHSAGIQADSLYEAAVEGIKAISQRWGEQPGPLTPIAVEVKAPTITHELTLKQIQQWLESGCNSPK